jgi:hypothetical protein
MRSSNTSLKYVLIAKEYCVINFIFNTYIDLGDCGFM